MSSLPRTPATSLFMAVVLFYTSTISTPAAENCVSYTTSTTAGYPEEISSMDNSIYFACADGSFLTAVDALYISSIYSLSWTCSDGDTIGSISSDSTADASVLFSVGITGVETGIEDNTLPFLADMYFYGYDVDDGDVDGVSAGWKGPLGVVEDGYELLSTWPGSYCGSGEFATGATVDVYSGFVFGVTLECATVTDTCAPPSYPTTLIEGGSSYNSSDDGSTFVSDDDEYAFVYSDDGSTFVSSDDGSTFVPSDDGSTFVSSDDGPTFVSSDDGSTFVSADDESTFVSADDGSTPASGDDGPIVPSSTEESSSDSTNKVIAIAASVGGALVLIAIVIGVTICCFCRRRQEKQTPAAAPAAAAPAGAIATDTIPHSGASVLDDDQFGTTDGAAKDVHLPPSYPPTARHPLPPHQQPGFVPHPLTDVRLPPTCPPMPDAEPPNSYSQETPPPAYFA